MKKNLLRAARLIGKADGTRAIQTLDRNTDGSNHEASLGRWNRRVCVGDANRSGYTMLSVNGVSDYSRSSASTHAAMPSRRRTRLKATHAIASCRETVWTYV